MTAATELFVWGALAHGSADWVFQNEWMTNGKRNWRHPAAWVHAGIQTVALAIVFPLPTAGLLGAAHLWVDTRTPLTLWGRLLGQTDRGEAALHVAIWRDQIVHLLFIAAAAHLVARLVP